MSLEKFEQLMETYEKQFGKFDAPACLRCIEIARNLMKDGLCSAEVFIKTKNVLLEKLEPEGNYSN
jgi:hypothetical protein